MALTVRPDDEVYQFDTVWLGPDEYTLPIQARYVAWGTWLACFLVAAVLIIPLGGGGPAGVLGSLVWSLGLSVVLSRAIMLIVDHERPLRSLPALFSAEARAAMQSRRRGERSLLVRPGRVVVRDTPPKVLAMRERQTQPRPPRRPRRRTARPIGTSRWSRSRSRRSRSRRPAWTHRPGRRTPRSTAGTPGGRRPGASGPTSTTCTSRRRSRCRSTTRCTRSSVHPIRRPRPPRPAEVVAAAVRRPEPAPAAARTAAEPPAGPRADNGGHFPTDPQRAESNGGGRAVPAGDEVDPHAALERRILLPARKDR